MLALGLSRTNPQMIEEPEIFRSAVLLINQHGERRSGRPSVPTSCDVDGAAVWRRILAAVEELRRGLREDEPLN